MGFLLQEGLFEVLAAYACILMRLSGVAWHLPVLGDQNVPATVRVAFLLPLALLLLLGLGLPRVGPFPGVGLLVFLLALELALGLAIGFLLRLILQAAEAGGRMVSDAIGLGFGVFVDPSSGAQSVATSRLIGLLAGLLVFLTNAHHDVLLALLRSFQLVGPGQVTATTVALLAGGMAGAGTFFFDLLFRIAFPVIAVSLSVYAVLAVVSRVVPQMNLFVFGFAVLIFTGLLILLLELPQIAAALLSALDRLPLQWEAWLQTGRVP